MSACTASIPKPARLAPVPVHRCTDRECCYFGQITRGSCRCHKSETEMLVEQRDALLAELRAIASAGFEVFAWEMRERAAAAIASVEARS